MVRCADEHSPIYLRAVLCLEPLARTVAPFFLLLQLTVLGDGLLLRRLCVCVCVWLWLPCCCVGGACLPCFCLVGLKRFELSGE